MSYTVALLDTENGKDSVADLITSGQVVRYDCSTWEKFEAVAWAFYYKQLTADLLVVDTLSSIVSQYVNDCTIEPSDINPQAGKTLWSLRKKMRTNQDIWNIVNYGVLYMITMIRQLPIPSIFNTHEREREDPTADVEGVDRHMPSLTPKILTHLMARSDLVLRLYRSPTAISFAGVSYPANTRVLQLVNTSSAYTGLRVTPAIDSNLPDYIVEPTLAKLASAVGYLPHGMTVYGFPKVGKTVFSCTLPN